MPRRDENGKRLGGNVQRAIERLDLPKLPPAARKALEAIGAPPLDDPDLLLVWGRKVLAASTWLVATGKLDAQRARILKDLVFAIGATHNRGALEDKVAKLSKDLKAKEQQGAVIWEKPDAVEKPPTARGQRRGPRLAPDEAPEADPGGPTPEKPNL